MIFTIFINPIILGKKAEKDERLSSPIRCEINDDQIIIANKFSELKMDWGSFQRVIESKTHFLLVHSVNKNMFQIIPKRAFTSLDDEIAFKNLLAIKLPGKQIEKVNLKNPVIIFLVIPFSIFFLLFLVSLIVLFFHYL